MLVMLVSLVSTCQPVTQAEKPQKCQKVCRHFVFLLMIGVIQMA